MTDIFSFTCSCCGKTHTGSPSFSFGAPVLYLEQPEDIQKQGVLNDDFCYYTDSTGNHYFIRVILKIAIHTIKDPFLWGVWVAVNEKSYQHYIETYRTFDTKQDYSGWLCNDLPFYNNTYALKTNIKLRADGLRPLIELHLCNHELAIDFYNGISVQKAQKIAEKCMHHS